MDRFSNLNWKIYMFFAFCMVDPIKGFLVALRKKSDDEIQNGWIWCSLNYLINYSDVGHCNRWKS